jgi:hypothetical protein
VRSWRKTLIITILTGLVLGGFAACQAARVASPEYQCKESGGVWVDSGYTGKDPYCAALTPKQPRH